MGSLVSLGMEHHVLNSILMFNREDIVRMASQLSQPGIAPICFYSRYTASASNEHEKLIILCDSNDCGKSCKA